MSYEEIITTVVQTYKAGVECCPFCGSHKVVVEEHSSPGSFEWYQVRCYMCEARAGIASVIPRKP